MKSSFATVPVSKLYNDPTGTIVVKDMGTPFCTNNVYQDLTGIILLTNLRGSPSQTFDYLRVSHSLCLCQCLSYIFACLTMALCLTLRLAVFFLLCNFKYILDNNAMYFLFSACVTSCLCISCIQLHCLV